MSSNQLFKLTLECKNNIIKIYNIVKNGKFNDAKKYLQKNEKIKIAIKFQIIDEKRNVIKQEKHSKEINLNGNFLYFNNEQIIL